MADRVPVILSTDVGNEIDDQWAVVYLLTQPAFDVRGIASAHAPSLPDPSAHSTFLILQDVVEHRLGLTEHPPLLEGASLPLANRTTPRPSAAASFIVDQSKGFGPDRRLNVVVIGAATDMASALLLDSTVADRVRVIAMAFSSLSPGGAHEYNEENDPDAWRVLLASSVPLVVGTGDVCRDHLSLNYGAAHEILQGHGPVADWLWSEYQAWYYRNVKPLRAADFSRPWVIWDLITLAYLRDLASAQTVPRPTLDESMTLTPSGDKGSIGNITAVDQARLWREFTEGLERFESTHRVGAASTAASSR